MSDQTRGECTHPNAETIPSYYDDTRWCPDCGAVRGTNGLFGPQLEELPWRLPKTRCRTCGESPMRCRHCGMNQRSYEEERGG